MSDQLRSALQSSDFGPGLEATTAWQPQGLSSPPDAARIALISAVQAQPILPELDLWDCWPLQHADGRTVTHAGRQWWFFLSAARFADPGKRHDAARIRLASVGNDGWQDHGDVLDPATTPGAREWAGSAVLRDDGQSIDLFFTAAGRRDEPPSFEQRLFFSTGRFASGGIGGWSVPKELFVADGHRYVIAREAHGLPGMIKGFRDPAWFRDPASEQACLLFTGSAGWTDADYNGVVGIAFQDVDGAWHLGDPLVAAIGVNNELERPHILVRDGRYYLFWSTQHRTFDPAWEAGPNGLYAMSANALQGPWTPVNGSGLVAANPVGEVTQGYSWWVTGEGVVWSFIDHWGMQGRSFAQHPELLRSQFGGTPAPTFALSFKGDSVTIVC